MTSEKKKGLILLKALIFYYHGLDRDEKNLLEDYVKELDGEKEYQWATAFISDDYLSAFERAKEFLGKVFRNLPKEEKLKHLMDTWEANHKKGYITEMETTAMINLSKDWGIDKEFMHSINE